MNENEKRQQIVTWFTANEPVLSIGTIIFGIVLIVLGLIIPNIWVTIIMIIIGVIIVIAAFGMKSDDEKNFKSRVADSQIDLWLKEDLKNLTKKSIDKLGVAKSDCVSEPVIITGPILYYSGLNILFRRGNDNILRYTPINTTVVNFTENQLLIYSCILDFSTGNVLKEQTDEYFYKDVVSASTKTESRIIDYIDANNKEVVSKLQLNSAETFGITTSGGTSVSLILRDPEIIRLMGGGELPTTNAENAIQVIRKLLRDKKNS